LATGQWLLYPEFTSAPFTVEETRHGAEGDTLNWYLAVLKNYAGFDGRARRTEYWMFFLINIIIVIVLNVIGMAVKAGAFVGDIYGLALLIPSLAVGVRRLHDSGRSGWWLLIGLIPLIGTIILIVFLATEGQEGDNPYGPDPKQVPAVA
jgi:uncharacterized membrane protein YhaH (DUF805 family)